MSFGELNQSFADNISLYRKLWDLSAEDCSKKLGIGKTSILNIEQHNANPTLETVETVAKNMGVPPLFLLGGYDLAETLTAHLLMKCVSQGCEYSLKDLLKVLINLENAVRTLVELYPDSQASHMQPDEDIKNQT